MAAILTGMSTPSPPGPPPRREGRRFTIPTPADLRHPGSRPAAAAPSDEREATPENPEGTVGGPEAPDAAGGPTVPPSATQPAGAVQPTDDASDGTPTDARPDAPVQGDARPPAPRPAGPTPGTLPRRGRPPAPDAQAVPPPRTADPSPESLVPDAPGQPAPDADDGVLEGARRMFPNPATLMAAGRGVRKVRPGGLRGRRLPKVEETSAGGVVLDMSSDPPAVALIARHDRRSRLLWSLPKGHVEEGETPEEAALREVFEETGLVGRIVAPLGVIDFWFVVEDKRIHKTVHHYVIEAVGGELSDEDVEVEAVEWIPFHQVVRKLAYGDERRLVEKVPQIVPGVK